MERKEEKAKVGRPKLADEETKKKAIYSLIVCATLMIALLVGTVLTISKSFNLNFIKGASSTITLASNTVYGKDYDKVCSYKVVQTGKKVYLQWDCKGKNKFANYYITGGGYNNQKVEVKAANESEYKTHLMHGSSELKSGTKYTIDPYIQKRVGTNEDYYGCETRITFTVGKKETKASTSKRLLKSHKCTSLCQYKAYENNANETYFEWECYGNAKLENYRVTGGGNDKTYTNIKNNQRVVGKVKIGKFKTGTKLKIAPRINSTQENRYGGETMLEHTVKNATFKIDFIVDPADKATGSMSDQTVTYGSSTKLSKNSFKKSNYEFAGWLARRTVNGVKKYLGCTTTKCTKDKATWLTKEQKKSNYLYPDQANVSKVGNAGETVTMIAKWKKATQFTVSFITDPADGAVGSMSAQKVTFGKSTALKKNAFSKSGHVFAGWLARRTINGVKKYLGCTTTTCTKDKATWLTKEQKKSNYLYPDQANVAKVGNAGETVTMIAKWKKSDKTNASAHVYLSCPATAKVNTKFLCRTNMPGVKISITPTNLKSSYASVFTTTSSDYTKQGYYTKATTVTVTASKSGYKDTTLTVIVK